MDRKRSRPSWQNCLRIFPPVSCCPHIGADFLQMIATQLDSATQLAVRCPQSGERVRHGQVLVAPATERMAIDDTGVVRLSAPATASPYNAWIDQIIRDAEIDLVIK